MASTYTPIATTTLGSAAANVTFSSIPATYTDLIVVITGTNSSSFTGNGMRFNGDTGTNYSVTFLDGNGSSAGSSRNANRAMASCGLSSNSEVCTSLGFIFNYANTTTYKTSLSRGNVAGSMTRADVSSWRNMAAINSVLVYPDNGANWNAGTVVTLYGITAA